MEKLRKYIIIAIIVVLSLFVILGFFRQQEPRPKFDEEVVIDNETQNEIEEKQVSGYHLVTYDQAANLNSFIQNLNVTASNDNNIRFVIGSLDENNFIQERMEFTLNCIKGENNFNLLEKRYLIKQGEYLFMDLSGQDFVYEQENSEVKSLIQKQSKKVSGKMQVQESDYILPYEYTLKEVQEYNCLVLGNEITDNYTGVGFGATEEKLDYYNLTKSRLKDTFNTLNINRINITSWEKAETELDRANWLTQNISERNLNNLDLVIFQLGDNFNINSDLEKSITDMVEYIKKYSPNVEMFLIGPWFDSQIIYRRLPSICDKLNINFIDISDLAKDDEYKTPVEDEFLDVNNELQTKVIYYPNNAAMQIISNRIIEKLGFEIY